MRQLSLVEVDARHPLSWRQRQRRPPRGRRADREPSLHTPNIRERRQPRPKRAISPLTTFLQRTKRVGRHPYQPRRKRTAFLAFTDRTTGLKAGRTDGLRCDGQRARATRRSLRRPRITYPNGICSSGRYQCPIRKELHLAVYRTLTEEALIRSGSVNV